MTITIEVRGLLNLTMLVLEALERGLLTCEAIQVTLLARLEVVTFETIECLELIRLPAVVTKGLELGLTLLREAFQELVATLLLSMIR